MHESDTPRANLRHVAENALRSGADAVPHLERLLKLAPRASDDAIFARRNLSELSVEGNPWLAALHLRELAKLGEEDEVLAALGGLAHALLGNFRVAVSCYRRALADSSRNPWYHHNLGHLLDIGLGDSRAALAHLRIAHGLEPDEPEIAASLAQCLVRCGFLDEAKDVASECMAFAVVGTDHHALLQEVLDGRAEVPGSIPPLAHMEERIDGGPREAVSHVLRLKMREAGYGATEIEVAHALWEEFSAQVTVRMQKPEVMAAAVEYTFSRHELRAEPKRSEVAERYGVSTRSVASRSSEIARELGLG